MVFIHGKHTSYHTYMTITVILKLCSFMYDIYSYFRRSVFLWVMLVDFFIQLKKRYKQLAHKKCKLIYHVAPGLEAFMALRTYLMKTLYLLPLTIALELLAF